MHFNLVLHFKICSYESNWGLFLPKWVPSVNAWRAHNYSSKQYSFNHRMGLTVVIWDKPIFKRLIIELKMIIFYERRYESFVVRCLKYCITFSLQLQNNTGPLHIQDNIKIAHINITWRINITPCLPNTILLNKGSMYIHVFTYRPYHYLKCWWNTTV